MIVVVRSVLVWMVKRKLNLSRNCMRERDNTQKRELNNMLIKPTKDVSKWFFSLEIGCGCLCLQDIRYPIPRRTHLLKRMEGAKVFSKFDIKSGFWQIRIKEEDIHKTAFVVPHWHDEWNVMPFGLKNAPSKFQNRMDEVYKSISGFCLIYIDDALIFSNSEEEHVEHLSKFKALSTVRKKNEDKSR